MKILITGGTGQVGFELRRSLAPFGTVLAPTREQLDLQSREAVNAYLETEAPDLVVNAAAYTAVDKAESESEMAQRLNAALPEQLADYAESRRCWLIHYSSDYVYPGQGASAFNETAETGPLGVYGQSKLDGDNAVIRSGCAHLIFRTSWVYSARGHNFMKTMLRLGKEREQLSVVADQIGAPTPARLIAEVTALAVSKLPLGAALVGASSVGEAFVGAASAANDSLPVSTPAAAKAAPTGLVDNLHGIYHLAPRGETSWHGFARAIFTVANEQGMELAISPEGVNAITTAEYPTPAQRPLNSRLSLDKLEQALGIRLPDWHSQLQLTLEEYL